MEAAPTARQSGGSSSSCCCRCHGTWRASKVSTDSRVVAVQNSGVASDQRPVLPRACTVDGSAALCAALRCAVLCCFVLAVSLLSHSLKAFKRQAAGLSANHGSIATPNCQLENAEWSTTKGNGKQERNEGRGRPVGLGARIGRRALVWSGEVRMGCGWEC